MARVVELDAWKVQREAEAAFGRWEQRVTYRPTPGERLCHLPARGAGHPGRTQASGHSGPV